MAMAWSARLLAAKGRYVPSDEFGSYSLCPGHPQHARELAETIDKTVRGLESIGAFQLQIAGYSLLPFLEVIAQLEHLDKRAQGYQ